MHTRAKFRLNTSAQVILAVACGIAAGVCLGKWKQSSPWVRSIQGVCDLASAVTLAWMRGLAVPLIVSSLVLGGVGLEPMRGMGTLVRKTFLWMAGSTLLAVLVAFGIAWLLGPNVATEMAIHPQPGQIWPEPMNWTLGWLGLVLVSIGFAYYRNQIEEGHGRLLTRFCQGLDGMLSPMLRWTRLGAAIGVFFLTVSATAMHLPYLQALPGYGPTPSTRFYERGLFILLATAGIYLLVLSFIVWFMTRIPPWKYLGSLMPAMWLAVAGQSVESSLPLTLHAVRQRIGVSNRVAGVTLSLGAALHRDGVALGWTSVALCLSNPGESFRDWGALIFTGLVGFMVGCGIDALAGKTGLIMLLLLGTSGWVDGAGFGFVLGWIIACVGGAISVFSHACATIVIARSEGEYWVPGPPPSSAELQGLKADLDSAEG